MQFRALTAILILSTASLAACGDDTGDGSGGGGGAGGGEAQGTTTSTTTSTTSQGGGGAGGGDADACETEGAFQNCALPEDPAGAQSGGQECLAQADGSLVWGACEPIAGTGPSAASTPIVLVFDEAPIQFTKAAGHFDLNPLASFGTDWVAASTPWLAMDRNGDGVIESGAELFGSATQLASGATAQNGFEALAELDANGDGVVDANDPGFAGLRLWADGNQDRTSSAAELSDLTAGGIVALEVGFHEARRCDTRGNCEVEVGRFTYETASGVQRTGRLVDVHLLHR